MKITLKLIKLLFYFTVIGIFIVCASAHLRRHHLRTVAEFEALQEYNPLKKTKALADDGKTCEALEYLEAFLGYDYVKENPEIISYYNALREERESYSFKAKDIASGVYYGKGACPEATISATVSDFLIIGDVRDLTRNALLKYYYDEESDDFTMTLAGVGIIASVITYASAGAAGGAKVSVSIVKVAKTTGSLSKRLQASLLPLMKKTLKTRDLKHIRPVLNAINRMKTVHGLNLRDTLTIIAKCHSVEDIIRAEKTVAQLGPKTGKFIKAGGESVLSVARRFPLSKQLSPAIETSLKYGKEGTKLVQKHGPNKFLRYIAITKYSARTVRSLHERRLSALLLWLALTLSDEVLFLCALISGTAVLMSSYYAVIK
jgi:hypothetical protein